ncbi:MAG TPA: DUF58 domain-containing protein [Polyangiales bacterium]|nr:DUF58 domain-containing protein [Polyangiales bacterium]
MRIFRRRRSRRKFRLTREGRAFLLVTGGVGFAAVNTANNLLYLVLGLLLSLLLVSGVLSDLALWKLQIQRKLPARMFAGKRSLIEVDASNEKRWLASVSVEVIDEIDGVETSPARFLRVGPGQSEDASYKLETPRRGVLELGTMRVRTRYPFGLIEKGYTVFQPDEAVVYPKLLEHVSVPPVRALLGDAAPIHRTGRGSEFAGSVRFYREGDEARDIHWKRTASRGDLVVREHEQDASSLVTLTVDNVLPLGIEDEASWRERFERRISEVATITAAYLARGVSVQVQAADGVSPLVVGGSAPDPIWRFLALLKPTRTQGRTDDEPRRRAA